MPNELNKLKSGFSYRLKIPVKQYSAHIEQLNVKVNALNLTALRIRKLKTGEIKFSAFAQISDELMVLLSCCDTNVISATIPKV
jgi:hypothetical protein